MLKENDFLSKKVDLKLTVILVVITFSLVTAVSENLTGNVWLAPGKEGVSKYYIDKGNYLSTKENSQCNRVGGTVVYLNQETLFKEKIPIELLSINKDVVLIKVNGARRTMEYGYEKYVGGLLVTVFSSGDEDACLIVRDWY